jgi:pyruvate,water dikinase
MKQQARLASDGTVRKRSARPRLVMRFGEITIGDVPVGGGKNASFDEMVRELGGQCAKESIGFAATADALRQSLCDARLEGRIRTLLADPGARDVANLTQRGHAVRQVQEAVARQGHAAGGIKP